MQQNFNVVPLADMALFFTRMTVPPRAIHTFKNASTTEPAEFFMTATPGKPSPDRIWRFQKLSY